MKGMVKTKSPTKKIRATVGVHSNFFFSEAPLLRFILIGECFFPQFPKFENN